MNGKRITQTEHRISKIIEHMKSGEEGIFRKEFYETTLLMEISRSLAVIADRINDRDAVDADRWIPVAEKLPEDGREVLIHDEAFFGPPILAIAYLRNGEWNFRDDMGSSADPAPVAWMPLPEPYKGA